MPRHLKMKPGQLCRLRHPVFNAPNTLVRIVRKASEDSYDTEYESIAIDGLPRVCYSSYLEPLSPIEVLTLEIYGKTPPDTRNDG
jgi:hypothetical protein